MEGLGVDCPKQNVGIKQVGKISKEYRGTCDQQACRNLKSILRPHQAQPRQSEENEGDQNLLGPETKLNKKEYVRNEPNSTRHVQRLHQEQMQMRTMASKRTHSRKRQFYVTKKDVERFGPTAGCPACANATKGISGRHAHNDECRDRIGKLLMGEGAQRIESYFERARVREETGSGAAMSSGFGTDTTDSQTAKRKGDDETNEMDERSKKRQTTGVIATPVPTVHVGGSSGSGGHGHSVSITTTEQRIVVPPEVPQDTRRCIEDMEISQLEMKNEVREVQGVSIDLRLLHQRKPLRLPAFQMSRPTLTALELVGALATSAAVACAKPPSAPCGAKFKRPCRVSHATWPALVQSLLCTPP